MSRLFVETVQNAIDVTYQLRRDKRIWLLDDAPQRNQTIKFRAPDKYSMGFSLDNASRPPLAFFSNRPPAHLAKMCDAIIAMAHKGKTYVIIIEAKTAHKDEYNKQLNNGRFFCCWLEFLCKEYGYLDSDLIYIGMLIWWPRKHAIPKGTTSHNGRLPRRIDAGEFDVCLEVRNQNHIALTDVVYAL